MNGLKTTIYRRSKDLPEVEGGNFFHSKQLFEILAKTPRQKPYMVVVEDAQGRIVSHMLGFLRYRTFIFPPFLLVHCRVLGEGEYAESEYPKDELFGEMEGTDTGVEFAYLIYRNKSPESEDAWLPTTETNGLLPYQLDEHPQLVA